MHNCFSSLIADLGDESLDDDDDVSEEQLSKYLAKIKGSFNGITKDSDDDEDDNGEMCNGTSSTCNIFFSFALP